MSDRAGARLARISRHRRKSSSRTAIDALGRGRSSFPRRGQDERVDLAPLLVPVETRQLAQRWAVETGDQRGNRGVDEPSPVPIERVQPETGHDEKLVGGGAAREVV